MIRSAFIICAVALSPALASCGFTPLHGSAAGQSSALPNMPVEFVKTKAKGATGSKAEYLIDQALKSRMMTAGSSPYELAITTTVSQTGVGLRSDDVASRYDLKLKLSYVLTQAASGDVIERNSLQAISTYNAPLDPYGTTAATDNALERASNDAADRLILKVAKTLRAQ